MCMLCYCCLIRPKETALLKCSDYKGGSAKLLTSYKVSALNFVWPSGDAAGLSKESGGFLFS